MNRLTTRNSEGIGVLKQPFECERCGDLQWSLPDLGNGGPIDRLAEYEDIGLTPEQIRAIDRLYAEKCKELAECNKNYLTGLELANIAVALKKLREYEDMEKKSKLIKLPCAVGNIVYRINKDARTKLIAMRVEEVNVFQIRDILSVQIGCTEDIYGGKLNYLVEDIGKIVFLTKEEAEAALEERKLGTV